MKLNAGDATLKKGKVAFFVTGNVHKFHEARDVLKEFGISTAMLNIDTSEIQADDVEVIAKTSAIEAAKKSGMPIFVEDAGLFIDVLKGFPGPYSSYVYRTLSTGGILRLMKGAIQREARFYSAVAFSDSGKANSAKCFMGKVDGKIAYKEQGKMGFGFDPIFAPSAEPHKTFAEITQQEKNKHSHRAEALRKFGSWYVDHYAQSDL
jgi:XTP/dITP diphosphohydrolase